MLDKIKLANGTEVSWEEFSRWSPNKQRQNLCPSKHSTETKQKIAQANRDRNLDPDYKQRHKQAIQERVITPGMSLALSKANKGKARSMDFRRNLSAARAKNKGPIHTPNGVFPTRYALAEHLYAVLGLSSINMAIRKIDYWCKVYPNDYYFIKEAVE
jgi:hypothetical protein